MLSRVAENIFWMSRYMERSSFQLRVFHTKYIAYQDGASSESWESFCEENQIVIEDGDYSFGNLLSKALFDVQNENSIANNIFRARENARSAQDHINKDVWQCLNDFHHLMKDHFLHNQARFGDPISVFDTLINQSMVYYGVVDNSLARDEGYCFLQLGKYVERILNMLNLIRKQWVLYGEDLLDNDYSSWRYFLSSVTGYNFYLRNNLGTMEKERIFYQMLYEPLFPSSISYCLHEIEKYARHLQASEPDEKDDNVNFLIGKSRANVQYTRHPKSHVDKMNFLTAIRSDLYDITEVFNHNFFGLAL
ncbi:alpha-E domain-containing protein [Chryseobacterium sp. NEB161]|nr:alpha-E domain-containing protein [Chryseobacterium sp. NEB161]